MISISFFATIMHLAMGYTSSTKNIHVFSCVYLPELFVDLKNVCPAEYECWNSQLRDYSRYSLFKKFAVYRSNVATATCDFCDGYYSNMFLMYYHWYLEQMAIHLSKKYKCSFLNKTRRDTKKNNLVPLVLDHSPDDLPEVQWPPLEPNFLGYQFHFAGFTFKLNRKTTHHTMLQKVSKHILNDNKHVNLFGSWNSTGHYTLASATFFGCTLIHFTHITGKTTLDEEVSNEPVGYFACVFAAKGQLTSQYGDLNAMSCLENGGVLQNWNDISLCAQHLDAEEEMHATPCQIYYNDGAIRNKVKRHKLCPHSSSNLWLKIEAPHEHGQIVDVYFSDNEKISVNITPREVHANLTLKSIPLIFQTNSSDVDFANLSSEATSSELYSGTQGTYSTPISQSSTSEQKSEVTSTHENFNSFSTSKRTSAITTRRHSNLEWDSNSESSILTRFATSKYGDANIIDELGNFLEKTYPPSEGNDSVSNYNSTMSTPSMDFKDVDSSKNSSAERDGDEGTEETSSAAIRKNSSDSTVRADLPHIVESSSYASVTSPSSAAIRKNSSDSTVRADLSHIVESSPYASVTSPSSAAIRKNSSDSTVRANLSRIVESSPYAYVTSPSSSSEVLPKRLELEDTISLEQEDAADILDYDTEPENILQWLLSCLSNVGCFLIACPIFLILLLILIRAHD